MNSNNDDDTASFHHKIHEIIQHDLNDQNTLMDVNDQSRHASRLESALDDVEKLRKASRDQLLPKSQESPRTKRISSNQIPQQV